MIQKQRRGELSEFLKACRARLTPEQAGFPPAPRRRTPGLRREEVAMLASVGVTWYTWLEQGRPINVSANVLDAVAGALRLTATEREHLYRLAELTPVRDRADETKVLPEHRAILHGLDPLPAVLLNRRFDVLASNPAHEELFWHWHSLPCIHKNLLWCTMTEPNARKWLPDYDADAPNLVARLRNEYGKHIGDPAWEREIRQLCELSPEFAQLWGRQEVAEHGPRVRRIYHPDAGEMTFTITSMEFHGLPDLQLAVYTPADEESATLLPRTRGSAG